MNGDGPRYSIHNHLVDISRWRILIWLKGYVHLFYLIRWIHRRKISVLLRKLYWMLGNLNRMYMYRIRRNKWYEVKYMHPWNLSCHKECFNENVCCSSMIIPCEKSGDWWGHLGGAKQSYTGESWEEADDLFWATKTTDHVHINGLYV